MVPKSVVVASAASRNSLVAIPWSLESTGTSVKDFRCVSNQVPPGGIRMVLAIAVDDDEHARALSTTSLQLQPILLSPRIGNPPLLIVAFP